MNPTLTGQGAGTQTTARYPCGQGTGHICLGPWTNPKGHKQCINADVAMAKRAKGADGVLLSDKRDATLKDIAVKLLPNENIDVQKGIMGLIRGRHGQYPTKKMAKAFPVFDAKVKTEAKQSGGAVVSPQPGSKHPKNLSAFNDSDEALSRPPRALGNRTLRVPSDRRRKIAEQLEKALQADAVAFAASLGVKCQSGTTMVGRTTPFGKLEGRTWDTWNLRVPRAR